MSVIHIPLQLWIGLGVLIAVAVIIVIIASFLPQNELPKYQYKRRFHLLTRSEQDCFNALLSAFGDRFHIFPQIHLAHLFDHKVNGQKWSPAFHHIYGKSVDFVLCDKQNISPLLGIELDDRSHERSDRQERDREVERIFSATGLPLLRLRYDYSASDLERLVMEKIVPLRR